MNVLASESFGSGEPGLVFLHGFTQTRASWVPIATQMAHSHRVTIVDLPGHGDSSSRPPSLDAAGVLIAEASKQKVLVGYSMGARIALHAVLQPHAEILGLVLIGAHPGIVSEYERSERLASDENIADRIGTIGVEAFLDEWLAQPMFAAVRDLDHRDRLGNSADGLAYALRSLGTGKQRVLDEELAALRIPTLLIVGEHDTKFHDLAERMESSIATSRVVIIPNAGHACHLERPDATREAIEDWLAALGQSDSDGK